MTQAFRLDLVVIAIQESLLFRNLFCLLQLKTIFLNRRLIGPTELEKLAHDLGTFNITFICCLLF